MTKENNKYPTIRHDMFEYNSNNSNNRNMCVTDVNIDMHIGIHKTNQ